MKDIRRIVITGVSSELGTVLAKGLARTEGVEIIGTMRRRRNASDKFPINVALLDRCDLTDSKCCKRLADMVSDRFAGPFGFVHSVGDFWTHVPFGDVDSDHAKRVFSSHVLTLYSALQALVPLMISRGGGSCVAFSCNSVQYNYPWMAAFTASKNAVDSLIRSLAHEFAGDGLRLNSLVLASLKTKKVRASKPHGDYAHFIAPQEIVPIVHFLMSSASMLVNGNSIDVYRYSKDFYRRGYFERVSQ